MTLLIACGLQREAAILAGPGVTTIAGGGDRERLEQALDAAVPGTTMMVSSGLAGALAPGLKPGDLVIGGLFPGESGGTAMIEALRQHLPGARIGAIIGGDSIIATAGEKQALHARTGAIAVDMESHIAARVAARHGLPFAIVRAISDSAGTTLPPAALVGMRPDGGMALGAVLASLARRPAQLPALIRTGLDAGRAFSALRRVHDVLAGLRIGLANEGELALDMR